MLLKTNKYRLYPSKSQQRLLAQTVETCRRWYNACLEERKPAWENERKQVGRFEQLAQVKDYRLENRLAAQLHSHILQVVVQDLDQAFQAFFRRVKAGETPGYPRYKGCDRFDSYGLKEYGNGFKLAGRRLRLTGVGRVRVRRHRPLDGRIKTVRICRQAGEWYACLACEVEEQPLPSTGREVGIDVGIHHLPATSDNETIDNPHWYRAGQRRLRVIQRRVVRRQLGGRNRRKAVPALQAWNEHVSNRRKDYLNKPANRLIVNYDRIALEDLHITGMVRNHHLSKSILDAGWGYLKQRLIDKAAEAGRQVKPLNPRDTSKTCSECGRDLPELTLADRWIEM